MIRTLTALAAGFAVSAALPVQAQTVVVDFEVDSDGNTLTEGDDASSAFDGVLFSLVGTSASPIIATEGSPGVAWVESYTGDGNGTRWDVASSGVNSMTDGIGVNADIRADFVEAVEAVSLQFWDWGDCVSAPLGSTVSWSLEAYDAGGALVASTTHSIARWAGGSANDGREDSIAVSGSGIAYVLLAGLGQDCGTAIDDFTFVIEDEDGDGVDNADDWCPGTAESDLAAGVPGAGTLKPNRWADLDGDGVFDVGAIPGNGNGPGLSFTIEDTGGCNCAQIIFELGLGKGHVQHGCSNSAMQDWSAIVAGGN